MGDAGEPQARDHHVTACAPHPLGSHAPVYFYEFQHRPSFLKDIKPPHVRADHGDELLFVFGTISWKGYSECSWAGSLRDSLFPECGVGPCLGPCVRVIVLSVQMSKLRLRERVESGAQDLTAREAELELAPLHPFPPEPWMHGRGAEEGILEAYLFLK